ncbi:G-alpha-domain-containing protein [Phanerochaete sordida]|uniref:G-alpha-domain-containing protein n=1 Tax=Phanerochaete sordida TaxID=48140 RepID=A0A9P3GPJ5_9APHY|nr:G-alpha-domain-containing protein [Phanerochaete sordida]
MHESDDPLTRALAPPPDETPEAKEVRLRAEDEARRVSEQIDEALNKERAALKKKKVMKMLLLGQSESGKSTTLKNMQMAYTPRAWAQERASWKAVIQLNLIRSINTIVDALAEELSAPQAPTRQSSQSSDEGHSPATDQIAIPQDRRGALMKLRMRLTPLRQVEGDLKARLGAGTDEITEASLAAGAEAMMATPFDDAAYPTPARRFSPRDVVVRSHRAWKERETARKTKDRATPQRPNSPPGSASDSRDSATDVLAGCADDMLALWTDPLVREIVRRRRLMGQLGDSAEYFLSCIPRIATRDYEPSDNDILRARIRTLGVQEYNLTFESEDDTRGLGREWAIYDVGGSRTSRAAWLPYFVDVHAILFLAPISGFDERLLEDRRVNRLEDSFILWQSICKSELLKKVILILFMNKCDLLERKLKAGIQISRYMTSYGNRANDFGTFSSYLKNKFRDVLTTNSPEKRHFYGYMTSVVDSEATAKTLASVRDGIIQLHLKSAAFVG